VTPLVADAADLRENNCKIYICHLHNALVCGYPIGISQKMLSIGKTRMIGLPRAAENVTIC